MKREFSEPSPSPTIFSVPSKPSFSLYPFTPQHNLPSIGQKESLTPVSVPTRLGDEGMKHKEISHFNSKTSDVKIETKEEFMKNFGKDDWLKLYQIAEIERNVKNNGKNVILGENIEIEKNKILQQNMEITKKEQEKKLEESIKNDNPEYILKKLQCSMHQTNMLSKDCENLSHLTSVLQKSKENPSKSDKIIKEDKKIPQKSPNLLDLLSEYNIRKANFLSKFTI